MNQEPIRITLGAEPMVAVRLPKAVMQFLLQESRRLNVLKVGAVEAHPSAKAVLAALRRGRLQLVRVETGAKSQPAAPRGCKED